MIAPSVMNLIALPAFAETCIAMSDDGTRAIVDPGEPGPLAKALDARRLEWRRF